jgi:hypothetical protein
LSNTVLFVVLGYRFFQSEVLTDRPVLRVGIRYVIASVALSFAVGIVMSINSGREMGEGGNLLLSHGLGVHGIQAAPIVALVLSAAAVTPPVTWWLHAAGTGWLVACTAALAQALLGDPPLGDLGAHRRHRGRTGPVGRRRQPRRPDLAPRSPRAAGRAACCGQCDSVGYGQRSRCWKWTVNRRRDVTQGPRYAED